VQESVLRHALFSCPESLPWQDSFSFFTSRPAKDRKSKNREFFSYFIEHLSKDKQRTENRKKEVY